MDPRRAIYEPNSRGERVVRIATIVSILALIITATLVVYAWGSGHDRLPILYTAIAFWALVPAWWFWYEYFFLYRRYGTADSFDLFRHGQQVAVAIWAGLLISLGGLSGTEHFKAPAASARSCDQRL